MQAALGAAQDSTIPAEFGNGYEFLKRVADDMLARLTLPPRTRSTPAATIADLPMADLRRLWECIYRESGADEDIVDSQSIAAAERSQLVRAFSRVNTTLAWVEGKVMEIIADLPKQADDIRVGRNKGDVLDPYILAATQYLLCGGDQGRAMDATVAHKALMVLEGMLGHLHEEVIGQMRGNVRVPEPRGEFAGNLNLEDNPFPGADVVQPPLMQGEHISFHQVKSKTGSMNSSAGEQLAHQMKNQWPN